jgi:transposase
MTGVDLSGGMPFSPWQAAHSWAFSSNVLARQGAFKWPPITDGVMRLSAAQLAALIEGLDWTRVHVPRVLRPQATQ